MHHKFLIFVFLIQASAVYAFKLTPIVQTFGFDKKNRTKSFRVVNSNKEAIKIEAATYSRTIDENGKENRIESDDFIIYPPIFEVPPGKSQVIRVSYTAEEDSEVEKAYRLIVRQIPGAAKKGVQLTVVLEYIASLYVLPKNVKENLIVKKSYVLNNKLFLEIENSGGAHILLNKYDFQLIQDKKKFRIDLDNKKYKEVGSINMLVGSKRKITIPLKSDLFEDGKVLLNLLKD